MAGWWPQYGDCGHIRPTGLPIVSLMGSSGGKDVAVCNAVFNCTSCSAGVDARDVAGG